jgi:hypothetical protein
MKELFVVWILSMMTAVAPPHREHFEAEAKESYAQADERYREIAEAIVDTSYDENIQPVFPGQRGRASTAMLVATIFFMESGFRRDLDLGTSHVRLRRAGLNDFGRSWCMGQINLGIKRIPDPDRPGMWKDTSAKNTAEGWSGPELFADRRKCIAATISVLRSSLGACRHLPPMARLAVYAAGTCDSEAGQRASEARMRLFHRWLGRGRPEPKDAQVLLEMHPVPVPTKVVSFAP